MFGNVGLGEHYAKLGPIYFSGFKLITQFDMAVVFFKNEC